MISGIAPAPQDPSVRPAPPAQRSESLAPKALRAFTWSMLGELASRSVGPAVFIVLARLLTPEDYGVAAAATVIISFSQVFSDAGLSKALIQRQDCVEQSADVVFWLNLAMAVLVSTVLLAAAPLIALFFNDERIAPVVRVLTIQFLLSAFSSVQTALMQKNLDFKMLFWVRLITTGAPGLASIPMAVSGMGYWAIMVGSLVGQLMQTIALWVLNPWRPKWHLNLTLMRELVGFGKWVMLSGLLAWFYVWMDAVVVGHYLGPHDMGLYRTGNTFVTMVFGAVFSPLLPVIFSTFSRLQNDISRISGLLLLVIKGIAIVAFPIAYALIALREPIEFWIFGTPWSGIGGVIAALSVVHGIAWLVGANGEAYRAIGSPNIETWAMGLPLAVYAIAYVWAAPHGLSVFLLCRLAMAMVGLIGQMVVASVALHL